MRLKATTFMAICVFLTGCTTTLVDLTPEEQVYVDAVNAMDTTFTVPKAEEEVTWGRIQSFIGKYSSMKIQTASDYIIETYNPSSGDMDYGYSAVRTPMGDEVEFTVRCVCGNMFAGKSAAQNARVLAYYAKTGELNPAFIHQ